jgi:hypothetical protein
MSKLKQPLRLWHGLLAIVAALAIGAAGTAIAGGQGKALTTTGVAPGGFVDAGKYHYGFKTKATPPGDSQTLVRLTCPRGTRVVGGGGGGFSGTPGEQAINFNSPFDNRDRRRVPDDGWFMAVDTLAVDTTEIIGVAAICVDKG